MRELRIRSYAKLMGVKLPLTQAVRTNGEAKILFEYYDARAHINHDGSDLDESKSQNDRALALIPEISTLRRDLSETLGEIQISFPLSKELEDAIQSVYKLSALDVSEIRGQVQSIDALETWKKKVNASLVVRVQSDYADKIQALLNLLYPLTDRA